MHQIAHLPVLREVADYECLDHIDVSPHARYQCNHEVFSDEKRITAVQTIQHILFSHVECIWQRALYPDDLQAERDADKLQDLAHDAVIP